jgi:hypothetical protein
MAISSMRDAVAAAADQAMTSGVARVFAAEGSGGLRQLVGTRVVAAIEVSESVLQDALRSVRERHDAHCRGAQKRTRGDARARFRS